MSGKRKSRGKRTVKTKSLVAVRPMVAGVDVGSREHCVCGPPDDDGEARVRAFGTTTKQLQKLVDWLAALGVESVAMESTSVYWIPLYELLESNGIEAVLVNARQLRNVPGRKTDVQDCQWLQTLHAHGLLRGSFRPSDGIVRLRALQRQQANYVEQRTTCVQWMQKALDQMNVQVHHAVSDITGETGMRIIRDIVAGERDPARLAAHRDKRCRKSEKQIAEHLRGTWRQEHLFNLKSALQLYDQLQEIIASYDERLLQAMEALAPPEQREEPVPAHPNPIKEKAIRRRGEHSLRTTLWRFSGVDLCRIDGIAAGAARVIMTEVGPDLTAFPTEGNFASWLRICPRTPISGGKPLKKRRKGLGANRVATVLRMAALSLRRSKTALGAYFRRKARQKSGAIAVFATARKLAHLVYRMLRFGQDYTDVGEKAYEDQFKLRQVAALEHTAKTLGYQLVPANALQSDPSTE